MTRPERLALSAALLGGLGCSDPASSPLPQPPPGPSPSARTAPPASVASTSSPPPAPSASSTPTFALASLQQTAPPAGPAPAWGPPIEVTLDDLGRGQPTALTLPAGRAALRLSPSLDDDTRCYRLDQLTLGAADWLSTSPDCLACGLPLTSRPTEGFWLVPGGSAATAVTASFSLRDCLTGDERFASTLTQQGHPLRWQVRSSPPLPTEATLEVRVALAAGVAVLGGADGGVALWAALLDRLRAYFLDAGVRLVVSRFAELPAPPQDRVVSRAGDEQELARWASLAAESLGEGAGEQYLPVVVVPCLVRDDLLSGTEVRVSGFTPRIPGGARLAGRAEAVYLAGTCTPDDEPPEVTRLARVLAHEMGHYLGLFHSDAPAGQPLAVAGKTDLMDSNVVYLTEPLTWSPRQLEALRLHPLLR